MKAVDGSLRVVVVLGIASLFVHIPATNEKQRSGRRRDVNIGVQVRHDEKGSPVSARFDRSACIGLMKPGKPQVVSLSRSQQSAMEAL